MKSRDLRRLLWGLLLLALALGLSACSHVAVKPYPATPGGRQLVMRLEETNRALDAVKGVGSFTLRVRGETHSARVAWIAAGPARIRLHVFGLLGQGQLTLAADGRRIYYRSPSDNRFHSRGNADPDLEKIVGFPINVSDLVALLMGRVPLRSHYRARILPEAGERSPIVLSLDRFWGSSRQKVYFDDHSRAQRVEYLSLAGKLLYRVEIVKRRVVNGFALPEHLLFTGRDDRRLRLEVDRLWVNPQLRPDIFTLTGGGVRPRDSFGQAGSFSVPYHGVSVRNPFCG